MADFKLKQTQILYYKKHYLYKVVQITRLLTIIEY